MKWILVFLVLLLLPLPAIAWTLTWTAVPNATNYKIKQSYDSPIWTTLATVPCCSYGPVSESQTGHTWWGVSAVDRSGNELELFLYSKNCPACVYVPVLIIPVSQ